MVEGAPGPVARYPVDVGKILSHAVPRVAQVVEEVRADDMPPKTPAVLIPGVEHPHGADADFVRRRNLETRVMKAGPIAREECDDMMIPATRQMHESDGPVDSVR